MNDTMQALMLEATKLTRRGRLSEATAAIQRALHGAPVTGVDVTHVDVTHADVTGADVIDGCVFESGKPASSTFTTARFTDGRLTREFKLFLPAGVAGTAAPLVVMLHGCTQGPDDFAAGTGMNRLGEAQRFAVLYPAQAQDANPQRCWNWFKHHHQQRGRGEAALIAALALDVVTRHGLDVQRVFVAGLSAGGAMAATLGSVYPDVFAAVGVHSGLAPGAAGSLPEALAAMRGEAAAHPARPLPVPTIVFHGDHDRTVHPRNGEQALAAALAGHDGTAQVEQGSSGGRRYTKTVHHTTDGGPIAEHWVLHGAGHAWSGGSPAGSHTDPRGPDASREMLRFFLDQATTSSARSASIPASS